ncbi:MAG: hypothetical protein ACERKZ_02880 [Lachnotalea sp.]
MKIKKGCYGYIDTNKKNSMIKGLGGLAVIVIIYVLGIIITKTRLNWFTFSSVLCALPVGKMLVNMIIAFPHKSMEKGAYHKINEKEVGVTILYDLIITSDENIMQIDSIVIKGNTICAYTCDEKLNEDTTVKYIKNILVNNGCSTSIKIFKNLDAYLTRIEEIKNNFDSEGKSDTTKERDKNKEAKIVATLIAICI